LCSHFGHYPNLNIKGPIGWDELTQDVRRNYFNVKNVPQRLHTLEIDPWSGFFDIRQSVTKAMMKKVGSA